MIDANCKQCFVECGNEFPCDQHNDKKIERLAKLLCCVDSKRADNAWDGYFNTQVPKSMSKFNESLYLEGWEKFIPLATEFLAMEDD